MNLAKKKKIVFLLSAFGVLETVFYCYHTKHHHEDIFETTNQDETNIDYVKNLNLTELDIKLQEKLKQATNKKVSCFKFFNAFFKTGFMRSIEQYFAISLLPQHPSEYLQSLRYPCTKGKHYFFGLK